MKTKYEFPGEFYSNRDREKTSKERFIKIGRALVPVSEEVYKAYYQMARHERYMENDIKVGCITVNSEDEVISFIPSKEDSVDRLLEAGVDFSDETKFEDIICDKTILSILQEAMEELKSEEQELIESIYYKELTMRDVAKWKNVSHVAIVKRHKKILDRLRKYFL